MPQQSARIERLVLWALAAAMLMAGFSANLWHAAPDGLFDRHQRDSQSLVIGRLIKSERDGLFSVAALNGRVLPAPPGMNITRYQYLAYEQSLPFDDYQPYLSQPGGQGFLFAAIDRFSGFTNKLSFMLFQMATAAMTAAVIAALIVWFRINFGLVAFFVVLLTTLSFQWLTVFGRNLWWVLWVFYLPMLAFCILATWREEISARICFWGAFWPMLLKGLLTGFEYVTTSIVMMATPLVFAAMARNWPSRAAASRIGAALAGGTVALLATLVLLSVQIWWVQGEMLAGPRHIVFSLQKGTHGDPAEFANPSLQESLSTDASDVLRAYINGKAATTAGLARDLHWPVPEVAFTYHHLLLLTFGCSVLLLGTGALQRRFGPQHWPGSKADIALIAATWVSVLAPLSWIVLFKGHSQIHTHMNQITWHMPFTFFAMALVGVALQRFIQAVHRTVRRGMSTTVGDRCR